MAASGRQRFGVARLRAGKRPTDLSWRVVAGVVLAALIAMLVIPVQRTHPDFSRLPPSMTKADSLRVPGPSPAGPERAVAWADLVPKGWNPRQRVAELGQDLTALSDGDPRALEIRKHMLEVWNDAPTVRELHGMSIRISGYAVPLETGPRGTTEFLLVPYFGACIHSPPPPANQIVHVSTEAGVKGLHTMDVVAVSGVLRCRRLDNDIATSGYRLEAAHVARLP